MLFRFFSYFSGMNIDSDIFKIQSNNVLPSRGKILISEPFLRDATFGRSVILLVDHTDEGSMGLVINKQLPLFLNDIIMEFNKEVGKYLENDGVYITGGIIESREDEVLLSFAQNGFEVKERFEEKGWLVFVVKKSK